jgi:hypothetical protein
MHKPIKYVEKAVTYAAKAGWAVFDTFNRINPNPSRRSGPTSRC